MIKYFIYIATLTVVLVLGCSNESEKQNTPKNNTTPIDEVGGNSVQTTSKATSDALHKAAERGDLETMKKLIAEKADINSQAGKDGETPLLRAITRGNAEAVKLLIDNGADVNLGRKRDGRKPLEMAEGRSQPEIAAMLKAKGAK